jgi:hypothetical protein
MPSYQTSITIDASPESIWPILSTVATWPRWLPTIVSVEPLDGDNLEVGRRFRVVQPRLRPATWVVTKVEPNRRFEWQAYTPGVLMVADHALESLAPGKTSVLLRFEFRGVLGSLLGLIFSSTTQRYIRQEAASLKEVAER